MKRTLISRRAFLTAGGAALALPCLEAMFPSRTLAAGTSDPKRYVCMYIASGTYLKVNNGAFWYPGTANAPLNAATKSAAVHSSAIFTLQPCSIIHV